MKCLYLTQELAPFFAEGGLGQTARALPAALERDHGIVHDLFVPYYPWLVRRHGLRTETVWQCPATTVGTVAAPARVERLLGHPGTGEVFLLRSDPWYDRHGIYRDAQYVEFPDATARAAFYGACVAQWADATGRTYDLVHGNDWQAGPALAHLRARRGADRTPALLANVHNAGYTGRVTPADGLGRLGLPDTWRRALEVHGEQASLLLLGLLAADAATTGSPTYARELLAQTSGTAIGTALERLPLTGIVAGIDTQLWQPSASGRTTWPYAGATVRHGKAVNKQRLQERLGLKQDARIPVIGVCSRLVPEKGTDLLIEAAAPLLRDGTVQLAVVGQGDAELAAALRDMALAAPTCVAHLPHFDQDVAWLTYAGADFTVMPSRVEPCGLNQLMALTYGTIPVVSEVGGLRDTVVDLRSYPGAGTGFVLPEPTAAALRDTLRAAARWLSGSARDIDAVRRRAMAQDWSWSRAARETAALYTAAAALP